MKKLLLIAVLAGLSFSTQARKVVFQVDMTGQTISANGVHLAGNLKDPNGDGTDENPSQFQWDPSQNQLTDPNADANVRTKEVQKTVRVTADDGPEAIKKAKDYYTKKGFKVHDHHYIGPLGTNEDSLNEISEKKFIVTYHNSLSDKSYTVMVSGDDEYDVKDKVDYALGMGDRITGIKPARGNEPTDSEYKVYVDPRTRTGRPGIYDREKVTTEDAEPTDREFSLVKKLGRLGERIVQNPKLWDRYDEEIDSGDPDWIISLIMDGTGATFDEVVHLSDVFSEIGGGMGRIIDFAWAVKEGTWEEDFMDPYRKYRSQDVSERVRDPEDWDEGNTEPGNNFAVYINGKKWKVLPGPYGAYADSPEERREFQRLQAMAQRKSQETGKKWEVYITGEPATR